MSSVSIKRRLGMGEKEGDISEGQDWWAPERDRQKARYHHGERLLHGAPEIGSGPPRETRSQSSSRWGGEHTFVLVTFLIAEMKYLREATEGRVTFCSQFGGIVPAWWGEARCRTSDGWSQCVPSEEAAGSVLMLQSHSPFTPSRTHPWNGAVYIQGGSSLLT